LHRGPMPPSTRRLSDVRIPTAASDSPGRPAELPEAPRWSLLRRRAGTGRPSARGVPSGRREEGRRIPLLTAPRSSHVASTSRRRRRTIMPRTCWCSTTQHWRHSTWPIGSGGVSTPYAGALPRQRRSRPNSSASLRHRRVANKVASGAPLAWRRAGSQPGEKCSFGRPLPFLYLPLVRRCFAAPKDLRQAPLLRSVLAWEFRPMTPYATAPVGVRLRTTTDGEASVPMGWRFAIDRSSGIDRRCRCRWHEVVPLHAD
jgi:hypothetical protein